MTTADITNNQEHRNRPSCLCFKTRVSISRWMVSGAKEVSSSTPLSSICDNVWSAEINPNTTIRRVARSSSHDPQGSSSTGPLRINNDIKLQTPGSDQAGNGVIRTRSGLLRQAPESSRHEPLSELNSPGFEDQISIRGSLLRDQRMSSLLMLASW